MKDQLRFLDYLTEKTLDAEAYPVLPIVEIAGDRRLLIENQMGVIQYCSEKIGIKVSYGAVMVSGKRLVLKHMTKSKLVISGEIQCVELCRRKKP